MPHLAKLSPALYADLIGAPFCAGAAGPTAWDCLSLALEMQRRQGRRVPLYRTVAALDPRSPGILGVALRLDAPEPGCAVLLRTGGAFFHIGTMVDAYWMLHASESSGAVVLERLATSRWARRVLGFYVPANADDAEVRP